MHITRRLMVQSVASTALSSALLPLSSGRLHARDYPSRPIEIIVPWGPGGGADQTARKIGKLLEGSLNVSLPVVNVPGGTGVAGLNKLLSSPPDGYSLCLVTADTTGLQAITSQKWSLDDMLPLAMLTIQKSGLFVREGGKFKSWNDITAVARTQEIKVAINGLASPEEVAVNAFKKVGFKFTAVPYQKPGERYAALLGDHVELLYEQAGDIKGFLESKQLKPILLLSNELVPGFESTPTTKSVGIDIVSDQYRTLMIRAGTPDAVVKLLADRTREAAGSAEYRTYLDEQTADPKSYLGPEETKAYIVRDVASLKRQAQQ